MYKFSYNIPPYVLDNTDDTYYILAEFAYILLPPLEYTETQALCHLRTEDAVGAFVGHQDCFGYLHSTLDDSVFEAKGFHLFGRLITTLDDSVFEAEGTTKYGILAATLDDSFSEITGISLSSRAGSFPFITAGNIEESYEWLTDILENYEGDEARIKLRNLPRINLSFDIKAKNINENHRIKSYLSGWHGKQYIIPFWHESMRSVVALTADDSVINLDTTTSSYVDNEYVFIYENADKNEMVKIDSFNTTSITLQSIIINNYNVGVFIMPAKRSFITSAIPFKHNAFEIEYSLNFKCVNTFNMSTYDLTEQYKGFDVFLDYMFFDTETFDKEMVRPIESIDYNTGVFTIYDRLDYHRMNTSGVKLNIKGRSNIWLFKRWLHKLSGKQKYFWFPSFSNDITLLSEFASSTTDLEIQNILYTDFLKENAMYKHLCFFKNDGSVILREITDSEILTATKEQITINSGLGFFGDVDDFRFISFMNLVRLNNDRVEFDWNNVQEASVVLSLYGVSL